MTNNQREVMSGDQIRVPEDLPHLNWEYRGEGLYVYWANPFSDGRKEDICMFMWPTHAPEDTAKVEALYEAIAGLFVGAAKSELDARQLRERIAKLEQGQDAWRLPKKDRHCPFCEHSDYETRGHAHYLRGVSDHKGVVCTDYVGLIADALTQARIDYCEETCVLNDDLDIRQAEIAALKAENAALRQRNSELSAALATQENK